MMSAGKIIRNRWLAVACLPVFCAAPAFAQSQVGEDQAYFVTVQVPGSVITIPVALNNAGKVAGYYGNANDAYFVFHGFLRDARGVVKTFDVPGSVSTQSMAMNSEGTITGLYRDANGPMQGFVRSAHGAITTFAVPGDTVTNTIPVSINDAGTITGNYGPTSGQQPHGFVRDAAGVLTLFDPIGSIQTSPQAINAKGEIVGDYHDANDVGHGFLREPSGAITTFDPPESRETIPWSINTHGLIAGLYFGSVPSSGFVRTQDGAFEPFLGPANSTLTTGQKINAVGLVAGDYQDASSVFHGLVHSPNGALTTFDFPGSDYTFATDINDFGAVVGFYAVGQIQSGYLRVPSSDARFQPGTYDVTDQDFLTIDGGFYLYGDPTVRLWPFVQGNPSQHWHFGEVPGGFTMLNLGTGQYASDKLGQLFESGRKDVWTVTPVPGGYSIKNNRTGRSLTDPFTQRGAVTLTRGGSVWRIALPE